MGDHYIQGKVGGEDWTSYVSSVCSSRTSPFMLGQNYDQKTKTFYVQPSWGYRVTPPIQALLNNLSLSLSLSLSLHKTHFSNQSAPQWRIRIGDITWQGIAIRQIMIFMFDLMARIFIIFLKSF